MWIDEVVIELEAGRGGDGVVSFRREKFVPRGGPDGGNGGKGGSIWLVASSAHNTLAAYRYRPKSKAERGRHGEGSNRTGRSGADLELPVPLGTTVIDDETGTILGDLTRDGERLLVAKGGRGGRGNAVFVSATHQAPRRREEGAPGESLRARLELRLLADVGLVGFPNAGKSTFISRVSAARPKIADYPFTTLTPHLGVVSVGAPGDGDEQSFVLADVPGLIPGASEGAGLGDRFLKHLSRTAHLVYFVDVSESSGREPATDLKALLSEVEAYGHGMADKPATVVASKLDVLDDRGRLASLEGVARELGVPLHAVSAVAGDGVAELVASLARRVAEERRREPERDLQEESDDATPSGAASR